MFARLAARRIPSFATPATGLGLRPNVAAVPKPAVSSSRTGTAMTKRFASSHQEHHSHSSSESSSTGSSAALAMASAMVFVPAFLYLTKPPEKYYKQKAATAAHSTPSEATKPAAPVVHDTPAANEPPTSFKYVLIGGGTASYSAMLGIRELDPTGEILIITAEPYAPYQRPPLSKELWFKGANAESLEFTNWQGEQTSLMYQPASAYESPAADLVPTGEGTKLLTNARAVALDVDAQTITLESGTVVKYDKVLLATGGTPRKLAVQKGLPEVAQRRVVTYRTVDDFKKLTQVVSGDEGKTKKVAVIGGGFLGSELSVALAQKDGVDVTQVFPEEGNMALVFPRYLTKWTTNQITSEGVTVLPKSTVTSLAYDDEADKILVQVNNGDSPLAVDHVVVAVGIEPNVTLAKNAGLEIDPVRGGIAVNAELEARHNVFAAGDNVSFHDVVLGRRRVEHYDNAVLQGRWAGRSMAGKPKAFTHQSMFWSDLGPKIGYEAMGVLDSSLVTVGVWGHQQTDASSVPAAAADGAKTDAPLGKPPGSEEFRKGVVFYVRDDKIVGVLMFNVHGKVDVARRILLEGRKPAEANELAAKFDIFA
ncbi:hypothetical protein BCR44DRAFT_125077 [Catenaria anguillulae PL171]|uniref:FAD/NAD(P)-binding domain-containing protein n=1 Tax=Catenaria anguillulae PL171 TaxID=765915 RepID=A0A1Y2HHA2_9FUNG|nr:hypothetical protein BCR44DRAFT_125077 [Catenaria anguillulae PL171]